MQAEDAYDDAADDVAGAAPGAADDAALERGPLRRCIVTREQGQRAAMLRFVVGPGGVIVPDLAARLPGRGIWLSARADVINSPRTRQAFSRAARARVEVPDDLASRVTSGLLGRIGDLIGFARRAGQAIAGYQKAQAWLLAGRAALIIQARDGSVEERARFLGPRSSNARGDSVAVIAPLPAAALGRIFGRDAAVHVAVAPGKLAGALRIEAARLSGVLGEPVGNVAAQAGAPPLVAELGSGGVDGAARDEDTDGI
jgi:predicted RNA-binding protein YlxR (DUF448 family)/ribosomal protein L7Ae-like RNA K-turn-binding protein